MLNQCNFIGNLTADAECRYTQGGTPVASFTVACNEKYKDKDGNQQEEVEFVRCVAWGKLGEICGKYLKKGSKIYCSGKMKTRKWQDNNNNDRWTTEVILREMKMLDSKGSGQGNQSGHEEPPMPEGGGTGEDVPF